ncbi:YcnI family copper-binding membrane protein [Micromonospora sp. NBC_01813]|uniref:YcnI family copper-binding membrane protein n=1 Tax=Micromonospora sp. NBC_01813 TaxID=2975988 RepID=UPI002DDC7366|nr:YcnI family protein [Micromonospora sp. NBC_01813]WSA10794.1 YcnI family protein [Micromonospora sp. NBC_01813]
MSRIRRSRLVRRSALRLAAVGLLGVPTAVLLPGGLAAAHVTVVPAQAVRGATVPLTFRVPNERSDASTVEITVQLPTDPPITSAAVRETPGWRAEVTRAAAAGGSDQPAVTTVTWRALSAEAAIDGDQFQDFVVMLGPVPDTERVVFQARQTYSDQQVVVWDEPPTSDGAEPARPAPVLWPVDAGDETLVEGHAHGGPAGSVRSTGGAMSGAALGVAVAALVVAVAALLLALAQRTRPARPAPTALPPLPGRRIPPRPPSENAS